MTPAITRTVLHRDELAPALRALRPGEMMRIAPGVIRGNDLGPMLSKISARGHGYPFSRALQGDGSYIVRSHPPGTALRPPRAKGGRAGPRRAHTVIDRARERSAAQDGRAAAINGEPITACPYRDERQLPLAADWRNAWSAEKDRQLIARGVMAPVAYTTATGDEPRERPHRVSRGHAGGNPRGGKG